MGTGPRMLAATRPLLSITTVEGIEASGTLPRNAEERAARGVVDARVGHPEPALERQRLVRAAGVADVDPEEGDPDPRFFAAAVSLPLSARHGPHHDPQTLTTTGLPAKSASETCLP